MVVGIFFVIICGFDLAYTVLMLAPSELDDPDLEGHSVKFNQTGALIPVVSVFKFISNLCFLIM